MRTSWRRVVVLGACGILPWADARALANGHHGRGQAYPTEYVVASEYVTTVPTTYVVPSALYVPTLFATSYAPVDGFAYVTPTVYRPRYTSYLRPAAYYYPTAAVSQGWVATSSSACCDPCAATTRDVAAGSVGTADGVRSGTYSAPPAPPKTGKAAAESSAVKPPASLDSEPQRLGSGVSPEPTAKRQPIGPGPVDSSVPTPPAAPVPERDLGTPITPAPAEKAPAELGGALEAKPLPQAGTPAANPSKAKPPVAPGGDPPPVELPPPAAEEAIRRDVQRPLIRTRTPQPYVRTVKKGDLHVLEGRVVTETGDPEPGVLVTVENRLKTFTDRVSTSDALGRYSVRLPDGDWTVKVNMPSGRAYPVSQLTVSNGQIVDDLGRDVPSLTITR